MELTEYFSTLRRWWWLLVLGTAMAAGMAYTASSVGGLAYQATATLWVQGQQLPGERAMASELDLLVQDYVRMITQRPVMERAAMALGNAVRPEQLERMATARRIGRTSLIQVEVTARQPDTAARLANTVAQSFIGYATELTSARLESARRNLQEQIGVIDQELVGMERNIETLRRAGGSEGEIARLEADLAQRRAVYESLRRNFDDLIRVQSTLAAPALLAEPAEPPTEPISDFQRRLNTLLAGIGGLSLAVIAAFALEHSGGGIRSLSELESQLGLYILGCIYRGNNRPSSRAQLQDSIANGYRLLQGALLFRLGYRSPIRILGLSVNPLTDSGAVLANLGAALAESGRRVLLLDANLTSNGMHTLFDATPTPGLGDWLAQRAKSAMDIVQPLALNLHLLPRGTAGNGARSYLTAESLERLLADLNDRYDVVLIDAPSLLVAADAAVLSVVVDGVVLVVESTKVDRGEIVAAREAITRSGGRLIGAIVVGEVPWLSRIAMSGGVEQPVTGTAERRVKKLPAFSDVDAVGAGGLVSGVTEAQPEGARSSWST